MSLHNSVSNVRADSHLLLSKVDTIRSYNQPSRTKLATSIESWVSEMVG